MKRRFGFIMISFIVLIAFFTNTYAQTLTEADPESITVLDTAAASTVPGKLKDVQYVVKPNRVEIAIHVENYKTYNTFVLDESKPYRIVIDIFNTVAPSAQVKKEIKSTIVTAVRYAQNDAQKARVVLEVSDSAKYKVIEEKNQILLIVAESEANLTNDENSQTGSTGSNNAGNGNGDADSGNNGSDPGKDQGVGADIPNGYTVKDGKGYFVIPGLKLTDPQTDGKKLFTAKYNSNGKNYMVTISNKLLAVENKVIKVNDAWIDKVEYKNSILTKTLNIIFYAKVDMVYEVGLDADEGRMEVVLVPKDAIRGDEEENNDNDVVQETPKPEPQPAKLDIKHQLKEGMEEVTIQLLDYKGYNAFRLTGSDRIVIDLPNVLVSKDEQKLETKSSLIKAVRYAQYGTNTARIVLDTAGQVQFQTREEAGRLTILLRKPTYKNVVYSNHKDRVYFSLNKAKLTEGGENLKKLYKESYDSTGRKYTITFKKSLADLGTGSLNINDAFLQSVEISNNAATGETVMTFTAKEKLVYNIITRLDKNDNVMDTAITVLKPHTKADKLVVIDPGHGGWDPGAVYENVMEKNLNLDISLRLNALLKSKNVKTYMIREEDFYVGLYERAYIANNLNASLFLSIHNNAFNSEFKGTETLYYPPNSKDTGFTGKRFAQIVQNEMLAKLNTYNRGIIERPKLVVLKATKMPSSLAEVAFITNKEDRARLTSEEFRQNAAQALCDAVIKSLSELK